uniref:tetratricopeptide repeat protein n=3 Tax=Gelidibacter sp. TaxID=2018083 RepID=UPI00404A1789
MKLFWIFLLVPFLALSQSTIETAEGFLNQKHYDKAITLLDNHLKSNSSDLKAIELLGDAYGHKKNWDESIVSYKKLVDLSPKTANYHYKYGGALGMKALSVSKFKAVGFVGDAKQAFLKAAELDAKHIDTRWALVEMYMQLPGIIGGSKNKALKYANELEALSKVDGYLAKGYIYDYDKEPELAESYYKKAVTTGGSVTCYQKITQFYIKQKQPQKALVYLKEGYKIHKSDEFLQQIKTLEKQG